MPIKSKSKRPPRNANVHRATIAGEVLTAFMERTGCDEESALVDLLANLMHWCDQGEHTFSAALEIAEEHFRYETKAKGANAPAYHR